jgi:acyl-CoA thioester hydrolase
MENFIFPLQVRWADLDPNFHLRHSVYYDWGAMCRIEFLHQNQLTSELMIKMQFGPILFREECIFRKEIRLGDNVTVDLELIKSRKDYSRWSIQHTFRKNDQVAAVLVCDGAWIDVVKRKLFIPPREAVQVFEKMPPGKNFQWLD